MLRAFICLLLLSTAMLGSANAEVVFDSITGATSFSLAPNTGNTFMGMGFSLGGTEREISIVELIVVNASGSTLNLTNLEVGLQFYDDVTPSAANAFASPILGVQSASFGALTLADSTSVLGSITLGGPFFIPDGVGAIAINLRGDTGGGLNSIPGLTTAIRGGGTNPEPAVGSFVTGSAPNFAYYRNASGRTDFNFNGVVPGPTDARQIGINSGLALRFSSVAVPEPSSMGLAALSMGLVGFRFLRRKHQAC